MPSFKHFDLSLLNPSFDSPLVDVLNELEHLRRLREEGPAKRLVEVLVVCAAQLIDMLRLRYLRFEPVPAAGDHLRHEVALG